MQDAKAELAFYERLFEENPANEHITEGYDDLYAVAFTDDPGVILDLGCGTGAHSIRLARRGHDVVSVDLSLRAVQAARSRLRDEGLDGRFVVADATRLPFRDGAVDTIWAALLLHHFPRLDELPSELRRVTRNRVIAFEPNAWNLLTCFAFNVVNRVWGIPTMTRNQRALSPRALVRRFSAARFERFRIHFADRGWNDAARGLRRLYHLCTMPLPQRFRSNKFLFMAEVGPR